MDKDINCANIDINIYNSEKNQNWSPFDGSFTSQFDSHFDSQQNNANFDSKYDSQYDSQYDVYENINLDDNHREQTVILINSPDPWFKNQDIISQIGYKSKNDTNKNNKMTNSTNGVNSVNGVTDTTNGSINNKNNNQSNYKNSYLDNQYLYIIAVIILFTIIMLFLSK